MNHLKNIHSLIKFSPRQGQGERDTSQWVKKQLVTLHVPWLEQRLTLDIPDWTDWGLKLDGQPVNCSPSGLSSGRITGKMDI